MHKNEEEVAKILNLPKKEKDVAFELLRLKGDYYYDMQVVHLGGELKVVRRPSENETVSVDMYRPCTSCYGFFLKVDLWRHNKHCIAGGKNSGRKYAFESDMLLYGGLQCCDEALREGIISTMRNDDITDIAKRDELICAYGTFLFASKGLSKKWYISQKMRILARILKVLNKNRESRSSLIQIMEPCCFDDFVDATKELCTLEQGSENPTFKTPSLALKIGYAIKKAAVLGRGIALRKKDKVMLENLTFFVELVDSEWPTRVSSLALNTLNEKAFDKQEILPFTEDLVKLKDCVIEGIRNSYIKLRNDPSIDSFRELEDFTASRILTLNKRRSNEACKVTIAQFKERGKWKSRLQEVTDSLKPLEVELTKRYTFLDLGELEVLLVSFLVGSVSQQVFSVLV